MSEADRDARRLARARVEVLRWTCGPDGRVDANGWTQRPASNDLWVKAARDLERQGVLEVYRCGTHGRNPSFKFRIRREFDG